MDSNVDLKQDGKNCCPTKVLLPDAPSLDATKASELEDLFKILANDTRLRLLQELARVEEICVCDLARSIEMSPQAISNQLQRLLDRGIVATRRSGNMIYYRIIDTCVVDLLQKALCLLDDSEAVLDRRKIAGQRRK